jgi:hypothetical protein
MRLGAMGARGGFGSAGVLGSASQSIPVTAARTYDFVNGTYTADGSATNAAAAIVGTVRTFTDDFLGDNWGAKTDPAYSNLYNVDLSSIVTGTIGGTGSYGSTGLSITGGLSLSVDVTNISSTSFRMRMYGDSVGGGNPRVFLCGASAITVLANTTYTISYEVRQIGSVTGPSLSAGVSPFSKGVQYNTSGGGFVSAVFPVGNPIRTEDQVWVPVTQVVTTPATGVRIMPSFAVLNIPPSTTCELTFEIRNIQITLGTGKMQYLGRGASASADNLTLNNLSTLLASDNTPKVAFRIPPDATSGSIFEMGSGSNRVEVRHSSGVVSVNVVNAGVSTVTTIGEIAPWVRNIVVLPIRGNAITASLNGKPAVSCGTAPSLTGMKLGSGTIGPLRGSIESCLIHSIGLNAANARTLSTLSNALFDDFDRADGAVLAPWSGPAYQQSGTAASAVISNKTVVATNSGGASTSAYFLADLGGIPKIMAGMVAFENNTQSASAPLISTPNNTTVSTGSAVDGITTQSLHVVGGAPAGGAQLLYGGLFPGASAPYIEHKWAYSSGAIQPKDGVTASPIAWKLRPSDGALAVLTWNREIEYFAGENYYAVAGKYVVFELYWDVANPSRPIWPMWAAEL